MYAHPEEEKTVNEPDEALGGWTLDLQCPLTPQPVRVQLAQDRRSGFSETKIGWAPMEALTWTDDGIDFSGAIGGVEGAVRLRFIGDEVAGRFTMQQPFAGTFPVSGRATPRVSSITTVAEAVDSRAPYLPVLREPAPLAGYTLYRPADDRPRPVVVWANGGGSRSNEGALPFLTQIAAAGFVVIAPGEPSARSMAVGNDASPSILDAAIAWACSSPEPYIENSLISVMGHSMGGVQTWRAASHPAVRSIASWNGSSSPGGHAPEVVEKVDVPTLIVTGGQTDGAHSSSIRDFEAMSADTKAVLIENDLAGHGGIFQGTNDRAATLAGAAPIDQELEVIASVLAVRWLNLTLRGDDESARYFSGAAPQIDGLRGWKVLSQRGFGSTVVG